MFEVIGILICLLVFGYIGFSGIALLLASMHLNNHIGEKVFLLMVGLGGVSGAVWVASFLNISVST